MRLVIVFLAVLLGSSGMAQGSARVALVVGNAAYAQAPLQNPVNDARAIAGKLEALGFQVILRENIRQQEIGPSLREFRSRLTPGAEALFFYAGHGVQIRGVNYLPAVDARIVGEDDVPTQSLELGKVLEAMEESKSRLNLVFLDACRNNPYLRRFRSQEAGLARVNAPSGTILSFATRPGSVATDGDGRHGLYTEHLLSAMNEPGIPIERVLKKVLAGVRQATGGQQEPWAEGGIEGEFYFLPPAAEAAPATVGAAAPPARASLRDGGSQPSGGYAAHMQGFSGEQGLSVVLLPTVDMRQALLRIRGVNHPFDGQVMLVELRPGSGGQQSAMIRHEGRDFYLLLFGTRYGKPSNLLVLPGGREYPLQPDAIIAGAADRGELIRLHEGRSAMSQGNKR